MSDATIRIKIEMEGADKAAGELGKVEAASAKVTAAAGKNAQASERAAEAAEKAAQSSGKAAEALTGYERVGKMFRQSQEEIRKRIESTNVALARQNAAIEGLKQHAGWSAGVARKMAGGGPVGPGPGGLGGFLAGAATPAGVYAAQSVISAWSDVGAKLKAIREEQEEAAERAKEHARQLAQTRMDGLVESARAATGAIDAVAEASANAQEALERMKAARRSIDGIVIDTKVARGEMTAAEGSRAKRDRELADEESVYRERIRRAQAEIAMRGGDRTGRERQLAAARKELEDAKSVHSANGTVWAGMLRQHGDVERAKEAALANGLWGGMEATSQRVDEARLKVATLEKLVAEGGKAGEAIGALRGSIREWQTELDRIAAQRKLNGEEDAAEDRAREKRIEALKGEIGEHGMSPLAVLLSRRRRLDLARNGAPDEEKRLELTKEIQGLEDRIGAERERMASASKKAAKRRDGLERVELPPAVSEDPWTRIGAFSSAASGAQTAILKEQNAHLKQIEMYAKMLSRKGLDPAKVTL